MTHTSRKSFFTGILFALTSASALAVPLAPGSSGFLPGTTVAAQPELGGAVINDNVLDGGVLYIPADQDLFGVGFDLQNRVVTSNADSTLIFSPRILFAFNISLAPFQITSLELFGFGNFATDVNYRTDGSGDRGPTFAERSADGDALTFDFGFPLFVNNLIAGPQEESYFITVNTDATAFANTGTASLYGTSLVVPGETLRMDFTGLAVPVAADIPLPATTLLFLGAMSLLFGMRRSS